MNLLGTWHLDVSTPFGTHPATLVFEGAGGVLTGQISSKLGNVPLEGLSVTHDSFDATVSMEFQGRAYDANISGRLDDDRLNGTIKVKLPIAPPVRFTGTRAS